jgi:hypothetical protein
MAVVPSLLEWAEIALEAYGQKPADHHRLLLAKLNAASRGEIERLMVLMPPGSAKSTYASVLFPAWWFAAHPRSAMIATSHTESLASHFGRRTRQLIQEHAGTLGINWSPTNERRIAGAPRAGASISRRVCADRSPDAAPTWQSSTIR